MINKFIVLLNILLMFNFKLFGKEILIDAVDSSLKKDFDLQNSFINISCYDNLHCLYALFNCYDSKNKISKCNKYLITSDGGKTWRCASIDCSSWIYDSSYNDYKYHKSNLVREKPNFYYSLYYDYSKNELISSFDSGKISRSFNYGKNWINEKDTLFNTYTIDGLVLIFLNGKKAIGYNNNPPVEKGYGYARIFISGSDFKNWKNIPLPDSFNIQTIYSIYNFHEKYFLLNETLKENYFYFTKTEDNGENWSAYKLELDSGKIHTSTMFFLNDTTGWIIGNYTENWKNKISVFFTSNGGDSWDIISDFFSVDIHKQLFFYNKNEGVMFSSYIGFITSDGGKTWVKLTYKDQKFPYPISRIVLLKRNEFICITYDGIIFKLIIPEE